MTHRVSRPPPLANAASLSQFAPSSQPLGSPRFADVVAQLRRNAPAGGDAPLASRALPSPPPLVAPRSSADANVPAPGEALRRTGVAGMEALTRAGRELVERVARGERSVERIVRQALSGRDFTPADLLALQAQMYRYTQEIELVSKVVDRGTSGLRTLLQQNG